MRFSRPCSFVRRPLLAALAVGLGLMSASQAAKPASTEPGDVPPFKTQPAGSVVHAGQYPPITVAWKNIATVKDVVGVFPHPLLPDRVVIATVAGLLISEDAGQSFTALPDAVTARIGPVNDVAFRYDEPDIIYVASKTKGLWSTTDNGRTFRQIGSKALGLASDCVVSIEIYRNDTTSRTLLLTHGEAAPGISRSSDAGHQWSVLFPGHHVQRIYTRSSQGIFIVAAPQAQPEAMGLYIMPSLGEAWQGMSTDILCTDICAPLLADSRVLVATADRGILRIANAGGSVQALKPGGVSEWASLGMTWGPTADTQLLYGFEPTKRGLALISMPAPGEPVAQDGHYEPAVQYASDGLLTTSVVREGAHIRANANGTCFYACINSLLYQGDRDEGTTSVRTVSVTPAVRRYRAAAEKTAQSDIGSQIHSFLSASDVSAAAGVLLQAMKQQDAVLAERHVTITAGIDTSRGTPKQVTVDLSRFNLSARTPMRPVGEGAYAATFDLDLMQAPRRWGDPRRQWPGILGLTVTAVSESGTLSGAVGALAITEPTAGRQFFNGAHFPEFNAVQNKAAILWNHSQAAPGGSRAFGFRVEQPGPWRVQLSNSGEPIDISGFYALCFWIRVRDPATQEISLQIRDQPEYDHPATTPALPLCKSGFVPGGKFTGEFQRVVVPVSKLLENAEGFQPSVFRTMILSGEIDKPTDYYLDEVAFYPSPESLSAEEGSR